ncbi:MAG: helix-turn-helix domain-containing protein [Candidatus Limnocylindrales bacterium]
MTVRSQATNQRSGGSERKRALVRGMTSSTPSYVVEFDARTVYDFLVSLAVEAPEDQDLLPQDRQWLEDARASLSPERRRDLDECFGESPKAFCYATGALAVVTPTARTAREFVGSLATADTRSIVREMLGEVRRDPVAAAQLERILDGADEEIAEFVKRGEEYHAEAIAEFLAAPVAWIDRIRGLLGEWVVRFEMVEERVSRIIERDLELRASDRRTLAPPELIERTTGGVRWLGEAGVTRVVMSPSYFARPFNYLYAGLDWRLFAYPAADEALDRGDAMSPPPSLIRLHRALGDESRLRILRLLRDRDMYLTELAQQLEVSKPTMKHHLTQLRVAGLVTVTDQGAQTYYSLRRDRLSEAGDDLMRFLA